MLPLTPLCHRLQGAEYTLQGLVQVNTLQSLHADIALARDNELIFSGTQTKAGKTEVCSDAFPLAVFVRGRLTVDCSAVTVEFTLEQIFFFERMQKNSAW